MPLPEELTVSAAADTLAVLALHGDYYDHSMQPRSLQARTAVHEANETEGFPNQETHWLSAFSSHLQQSCIYRRRRRSPKWLP